MPSSRLLFPFLLYLFFCFWVSRCFWVVDGLGRYGYGHVFFFGRLNVAMTDLYERPWAYGRHSSPSFPFFLIFHAYNV